MLCDSEKCLGCYACANSCPNNAIVFCENAVGVMIPAIQEDKCVDCHLCEWVCPVLNPIKGRFPTKCFAAWSSDDAVLSNSASGGIVSTLYREYIKNGGFAFGTKYENGVLCIAGTDSINEAKDFAGSKYIHAYAQFEYKKIKTLLHENRKVVFAGLPCQVAALRSYLNKDYENLLLIDIICHGVSPQKYLREYVKSICHSDYDKAFFRGKNGNCLAVYNSEKLIYCKEKWYDAYSMAYANGMISRENCYQCPYASLERQGDMTVGDFWGLDGSKLKNDAGNIPFVSLILLNTEKGENAFKQISSLIVFEERNISEAVNGNMQLHTPCNKHGGREKFLSLYKKHNFMYALKHTKLYWQIKKIYLINKFKHI